MRDDTHVGVHAVQAILRGVDLRTTDVIGREHHLALQVGEVDVVEIDEADRADTGRGEVQADRGAEAAGAHDQHTGVAQLLLPLPADFGKRDVSRVALNLITLERAGGAGTTRNARYDHERVSILDCLLRAGYLVLVPVYPHMAAQCAILREQVPPEAWVAFDEARQRLTGSCRAQCELCCTVRVLAQRVRQKDGYGHAASMPTSEK